MPQPLKEGQNIIVSKRCFPFNYQMDTLQAATDHYNLGFILSGDRKCITPSKSFHYHKNDVSLMPPYVYHQTISLSNAPYESYFIKFSPQFAEPFQKEYGTHVFHELYKHSVYHFSENDAATVMQQFCDMHTEYEQMNAHRDFILQGMLFRLFENILRLHIPLESSEIHVEELENRMIDVLSFMEKHYHENPSVGDAAKISGFSVSHFSRIFRKKLGKTYADYLEDIKLRHVQMLLSNTSMSIMEIAAATGYCHGNYLCERFKRATAMSPTEYRKRF